MSDYLRPAAATLLPYVGGFIGSFTTRHNKSWLKTLNQPPFTPPSKVFGPVWMVLYGSMGYASYLVWRDGGGFSGDAAVPLAWYGTQLALNWAWPFTFFGCRSLKWGLVNNMALWGALAGTIYTFKDINTTATYLLVPYISWVTLANVINLWIWWYNPPKTAK